MTSQSPSFTTQGPSPVVSYGRLSAVPAPSLDTPCIRWTGAISSEGYGRTTGAKYAHRVAWSDIHGPIPSKMQIDHICRNRACVNVKHLEIVTNRTNTLRGMAPSAVAYRTNTCYRGHPMVGRNVYRNSAKTPARTCAECKRIKQRERYRTDDVYRANQVARSRANHARRRNEAQSA